MLDRNFMPGGQVKSQLKDLRNVLVAAGDAGVVLPVTALVTEAYASIETAYPRADQSAALLALEKRNPGQRVGQGADQLP
jgi:2-hydroxy-3-oxopropionate reductase